MAEERDDTKAEPGASTDSDEVEIAERTAVGCGRPHNEDYVQHCVPAESRVRARKGILCLVADGMGGHRAGEVASREAVEQVVRHYCGEMSRDVASSLLRALRAANAAIAERAEEDRSRTGMGTTLVGAAIRGRQVLVANVGDSRAYHVGKKGISQITEDHSWVEEQVRAGFLAPDQARTHPQRNLVTRALGTRPEIEIDLYEGVLGAGDCLVLCTDGLSNQVSDKEIELAVRMHSPDEAAQALLDLVKERGGRDDATVLVVRVAEEEGGQRQPTAPRVGAPVRTMLLLGGAALLGLLALLLYLLPGM